MTPLMVAVSHNNMEMVKFLVEHGADIHKGTEIHYFSHCIHYNHITFNILSYKIHHNNMTKEFNICF